MEFTDKEILLSWSDIDGLIENICLKIKAKVENAFENHEIIAITNGGSIQNINLFPIIDKKIIHSRIPKFDVDKRYLLVDEIYDTGKTFRKTSVCLEHINHLNVFLVERYSSMTRTANHIIGKTLEDSRWVVFPWEKPKQTDNIS